MQTQAGVRGRKSEPIVDESWVVAGGMALPTGLTPLGTIPDSGALIMQIGKPEFASHVKA